MEQQNNLPCKVVKKELPDQTLFATITVSEIITAENIHLLKAVVTKQFQKGVRTFFLQPPNTKKLGLLQDIIYDIANQDGIFFTELSNQIIVVNAKIEVEAASLEMLYKKIGLMKELDYKKFIIDFSQMGPMSGTGLGHLINIADLLESDGGKLVICSLSPSIQQVFKSLALSSLMRTFSNEEQAYQFVMSS